MLDIFVAALFLAALFLVGLLKSRKVHTETSYLVADRKASLFGLTATLVMTEFNTATLLSFSSVGYLVGGWALSLPAVFLFGLLFYAFSVSKKWKEFDGISVASYFSKRYGRDIGVLASVALLVAMAGFSAAYVKSLFLLFTPIFPHVGQWTMSSLLVLLVLLMMLRGGLFSIIRTDVLSFVVALLFFPALAYFSSQSSFGAPTGFEEPLTLLPPRFVISLVILTMFTYILAPWYGQKIFAAKSKKTAYLSVLLAAVLVFFLYGCAVLTTWFFRKNGGEVPSAEQALPFAIQNALPGGLRGLGFALFFAASATTLTGVWSAMCTLLVGDFFAMNGKESYKRSMGLTVAFAALSLILANLLVDKVFDKLILANIPVAALSFALLGGFYWKGVSRFGAYLSMIVGWGWGLFCYLHFGEAGGYTWYWAVLGIPAIFGVGIIGSLLVPNRCVA